MSTTAVIVSDGTEECGVTTAARPPRHWTIPALPAFGWPQDSGLSGLLRRGGSLRGGRKRSNGGSLLIENEQDAPSTGAEVKDKRRSKAKAKDDIHDKGRYSPSRRYRSLDLDRISNSLPPSILSLKPSFPFNGDSPVTTTALHSNYFLVPGPFTSPISPVSISPQPQPTTWVPACAPSSTSTSTPTTTSPSTSPKPSITSPQMLFSQYSPSPPAHSGPESTSPSRSSRLRRFSNLRGYSHRALEHRDSTTTAPSSLPSSSPAEPEAIRARLHASINNAISERSRNRLTLVSSSPNPSRPAAALGANSEEPSITDDTSISEQPATMTRARSLTAGDAVAPAAATAAPDFLPSIRLSAYYDPRSSRPSLTFPPISRTLPTGTEAIRVGRYSERDCAAMASVPGNQPSSAPVGFKSKVVSRRHCEFWYENGKWFIKDVKSSSGTFLNHIRLSPPSQESKAFPVNDGDIVQLGIDFKGGEEMIFRCVKMRVELNRGWQNKLNTFNMAAHKRLRTMGKTSPAAGSQGSSDCSICLNQIAPCQSLFVAPCSHTWHFKCVRSLLQSPQYPIFICPNCRAGADLEGDVEDPAEDWEQLEIDEAAPADTTSISGAADALQNGESEVSKQTLMQPAEDQPNNDTDTADLTNASEVPGARGNLTHTTSAPLPISNPASGAGRASMSRDNRTPSPPGPGAEGPITPRNEAGPWVFDGSAGVGAGGSAGEPTAAMASLDAAADMTMTSDETCR